MQLPALHSFLKKYAGAILFFIFCLIGIFTFDVYGISWDEDYQREIGMVSWNYIVSNDPTLLSYPMRDYGVAFELPLIALEKAFNFSDEKNIYLMRHLASHLFFLIGAFYFFKLIDLLYDNKLLAVLGFLLFVLHPAIYAHSFFNSKDVPFLSLLSICFYLSAKALHNRSVFAFVLLGTALGLLINIRIMGSLLLFCVLLFLVMDAISEKRFTSNLKLAAVLVTLTCAVLLLSWPYLWADPIHNYVTAFKNMSQFRWPHTNLFRGVLIPGGELPWDYVPSWFLITTPISYLLLGLVGISVVLISVFKNPRALAKDFLKKYNVIFLICFILPVVAVIVLHSVLYDGWRHMYFIYPPFVMLCIYGLYFLFSYFKKPSVFYTSISLIIVAGFMIRNFPLQHLYFNSFVSYHSEPEYIRKNYEMDYWGTSFKQALEYILKKDKSDTLNICVKEFPTSNLYILLSPEERTRIHFVSATDATYFVTNYRWHPQDYSFTQPKLYSLRVLNSSVIDVYKLK